MTFLPKQIILLTKFPCLLLLALIKLGQNRSQVQPTWHNQDADLKSYAIIQVIRRMEVEQTKKIFIIIYVTGKRISET